MILRTALVALLATAALPAWSARPLVSDDAAALDSNTCEIEGAGHRITRSGDPDVTGLEATFACGVGSSTQLALGAGQERGGGITVRTLVAGGKTIFRPADNGATGLGIAYAIDNVHVPGEGSKFDNVSITGLVTREIVPGWLLHGNLGWNRSRAAHQNTTTWSVGLESTSNPVFAADVFGDDRGRPAVSTGVGFSFTRDFSMNVGVAQQFESPAIRQWTLGAKMVF
jgi:hypothetical protein